MSLVDTVELVVVLDVGSEGPVVVVSVVVLDGSAVVSVTAFVAPDVSVTTFVAPVVSVA